MRCRIRCASSSFPSSSNCATCSSSSCADLVDRALDGRLRGDVLRRRPDREVVELREHLARERVEVRHPLDLVAEERDAVRRLLVRRLHLDHVALHAEAAAAEHRVVADVLRVDQLPQQQVAVVLGADLDVDHPLAPLLRRAEAVDAGDGRDHDHVAAREERRRRGEPQPRDVVVPGRVLLDVEVGLRDVRLGLVVVVVGDEVLDGVVREELPELVAELRRERLVVGDHERRPAGLLDRPRHRRRLAGAGRADERLVAARPRGSRRRASRSPAAGRRSGCRRRWCAARPLGTGYLRPWATSASGLGQQRPQASGHTGPREAFCCPGPSSWMGKRRVVALVAAASGRDHLKVRSGSGRRRALSGVLATALVGRVAIFLGLAFVALGVLGVSSAADLPLAGNLDPSFGNGGVVTRTLGATAVPTNEGIAVQPDGKIVVVTSGSVVRYLPDGSLDSSFGAGGSVATAFDAAAVALQPAGKIVVAGAMSDGSGIDGSEFAVARYNPDGSPDASFGTDGSRPRSFHQEATSSPRKPAQTLSPSFTTARSWPRDQCRGSPVTL